MPANGTEIDQLKAGIAALEAQRAILGDAVVEASVASLREKLAALEAQDQPEQQRKQATVLFADVSGFTALSETMDAEVVAGIMNDLWAAVDRAIIDHGGRIDKHIGDAVMALWGAEQAKEDDPERAVRGALAMQAAIEEFCATAPGAHGEEGAHRGAPLQLAMRIGVNTGPVLLGQVGSTAEFTAMGDAVNLASRLEHAAPTGGVLVSHDTYRHIRGVFDVITREPLTVKGKAEPVQTYLVQRAKPRAFRMATRGVEGIETRMVGRDRELGILKDAFADAIEGRETRVITVIGEAGVGKSRLLYEFDNWIELRPELVTFFKGRGTANTQNVPFSLFRDLFAFRFDILDSDSVATAFEKFKSSMAGYVEPD
jgi:class 3 adenylate cyclase